LHKIIKTRGSFPNEDAALKLLYLAIKNAGLRWRRGVEWTPACDPAVSHAHNLHRPR
jgi:putative transposase